MKEYNCNWLTFFFGSLLTVGVFQGWMRYIVDCLNDPDKVLPLRASIAMALVWATGWTFVSFFVAHATDKMSREAQETAEDAPVKSQMELSHTNTTPAGPLPKKVLLATFGVASAIAGGASVVAHVWNGSIGAGQVVLFTLFVPASVTLGVWLMRKARLEPSPKPLSVPVTASQTPVVTPTVQPASAVPEAEMAALRQGRR